jgi:hypothetical protein
MKDLPLPGSGLLADRMRGSVVIDGRFKNGLERMPGVKPFLQCKPHPPPPSLL